jgi:hypothetical protein
MKTTVEIEDKLLVQAKQHAAELHSPLRALIEAGLRQQLQRPQQSTQKSSRPRRIRWVVVPGGAPEGSVTNDREGLYDWLKK